MAGENDKEKAQVKEIETKALALCPTWETIGKENEGLIAIARKVLVKDAASLVIAKDTIKKLDEVIRTIDTKRKLGSDPLYKAWKVLTESGKKTITPFETIRRSVIAQVEAYDRKLLAEKKAEEERIAKEKADLEQREKEAKEKADAEANLKVKAHEAVPTTTEDDIVIPSLFAPPPVEARALSAEEEEIQKKKAELTVQTIRVASSVPTSSNRKWRWKITDGAKIPREYLVPDTKAIDKAVADGIRFVEGLEIYEDVQYSGR